MTFNLQVKDEYMNKVGFRYINIFVRNIPEAMLLQSVFSDRSKLDKH